MRAPKIFSRVLKKVPQASTGRQRAPDELHEAKVVKEKALAAKAKAETLTSNIEAARKAAAAWIVAYGILGVFSYSFFDIKFFPSGLTAGDVLFYAFVALGLGLLSLVCAVFGLLMFLPASMFESSSRTALHKPPPCAQDGNNSPGRYSFIYLICGAWPVVVGIRLASINVPDAPWEFPLVYAGGVLVSLLVVWFLGIPPADRVWEQPARPVEKLRRFFGWGRESLPKDELVMNGLVYALMAPIICWIFASSDAGIAVLLLAVVLPGFALTFAMQFLDEPVLGIPTKASLASQPRTVAEKRSFRLRFAGILAVAAIVLPAIASSDARIYVFSRLGFLAPNVALGLNASNLALVTNAADAAGITLSICRSPDGSAIVSPIDVRWHGVGSRSLIALKRPQTGQPAVEIGLETAGVTIVRNSSERCIDVAEAAIFQSGLISFVGGETPDRALARLNELLKPHLIALKGQWRVRELVVVGHADPMPLANGGNAILGQRRANAVRELLCASDQVKPLLDPSATIEARTAGAREPLKVCSTYEPLNVQRECNEVNRRVEIRLRVVPSTSSASTTNTVNSQHCQVATQ